MTTSPAAAERSHGRRRGAVAGWVRRRPLAASILLLVLVTLAVRLVWGWHLASRVAAELDAIRSRGEPATLADIVVEPMDDADNAWLAFMRAHAAIKPRVYSPRNSDSSYPSYPPYGAEWEALAEASERKHAAVFPLARAARRFERGQLRPGPPTLDPFSGVNYNGARNLANTVADGAIYAHLKGRDGEAIERLLDLLHLAKILRQDPLLISQLVGNGISALATVAGQQIAPTLAVGDAAPQAGDAPASRAQVRALIAALLDETDARQAFARTMIVERAFVADVLRRQAHGTWAIRPLADRQLLRWLDGFGTIIDAADEPNYAAATRVTARLDRKWERTHFQFPIFGNQRRRPTVPRYSRWFEEGGPPSTTGAIMWHYRDSGQRRVIAVSFATRLYRLDHGRWPDALADLVPEYLSAVPTDPFLDGDQPLGYIVQRGVLPGGGDRPLVYFDAEGTEGVIDSEPMIGWQNEPRVNGQFPTRQYRDLSLWLPTTRRFDEEERSRAEAVEDDPEEPDTPGDDEEDDDEGDNPAEE